MNKRCGAAEHSTGRRVTRGHLRPPASPGTVQLRRQQEGQPSVPEPDCTRVLRYLIRTWHPRGLLGNAVLGQTQVRLCE